MPQASTCTSADSWGCTFKYWNPYHSAKSILSTWDYRTPQVHSVVPKIVQTGTLITFHGLFPEGPFNFDEVKSPVNEVPLVSVKIANKASANVDNKAKDEPFGQSGSRCAIFEFGDGDELPLGVFKNSGSRNLRDQESGPWVYKFICQVEGQREGGRYNISVALLGPAHNESSEYGEALVLDNLYQSNHIGDAYMITQMPVIYSIYPTATGTLGGARLTIIGDSFTVEKEASDVMVGDTQCTIQTASLNEIVCTVGEMSNDRGMHNGIFGITGESWGRKPPADILKLVDQGGPPNDWFANHLHDRYSLQDYFETHHGIFSVGRGITSSRRRNMRSSAFSQFSARMKKQPSRTARRLLSGVAAQHAKLSEDRRIHLRRDFDSGGHLSGIFIAPATGNYTLIAVSNSNSSVWVNREKVLHVGNHDLRFRDFSRNFAKTAHQTFSIAQRVKVERERRSLKLYFEKGSGYVMDAYFRSLYTLASQPSYHFSLGAVLHSSTVNERDTPNAIDEKQFISVQVDTNYTKIKITFKKKSNARKMGGEFRLTLGGKESRTIGSDASDSEMAAALRELFNDCSTEMKEPYSTMDGGGSASDCAMGHGIEYRGLKATSLDGEECLRWDAVPADQMPWDPHLAMTAGLDGNLCRNPRQSFEADTRPFCYVASGSESVKKHCVRQCEAEQSAMVATFEGIHETAPGTAGEGGEATTGLFPFHSHSGVTPRATKSESFCGKSSLFFSNTFARFNKFWGSFSETDGIWKTDVHPYLCFAYKIRPGSEVSMKVRLRTGHGGRWGQVQRWIILNTYMEDFTKGYDKWWWPGTADNPGIVADNEWHYTCTDMRQLIESALAAGDRYFVSGYGFQVLDLDFTHPFTAPSSYADNPFWIDEFSISKAERVVKKTGYPIIPLQIVDVIKIGDAQQEVEEWVVTMSTAADDCKSPEFDLVIDASNLQEVESADIIELQEHSPPLAGNLLLGFGDDEVAVNLYSSAVDLKASLTKMSSIGEVEVTQTGTCQTGYGWIVRFASLPGDQPLISASLQMSSQSVGRARVKVTEMEAGGVLMYPLPSDYFRQQVTDPQPNGGVKLSVHGVMAECELDGICSFECREDLTPTVSSSSQVREDVGTYLLTLTGTNLESESGSVAEVTVEHSPCHVVSSTTSRVTCRLMLPFLPQGSHAISVKVPELGKAQHNPSAFSFNYSLEISNVEPSNFSTASPIELTVHGAGFNPVLSENEIEIEGAICAPKIVNATFLVCALNPSSVPHSSSRRAGVSDTDSYISSPGATLRRSRAQFRMRSRRGFAFFQKPVVVFEIVRPTISPGGVSPSRGSVGGGTTITIKGAHFPVSRTPVVTMGPTDCRVETSTATEIVCETSSASVGIVGISIQNPSNGGTSDPSNEDAKFEYVLAVSSITPSVNGMGGGSILKVTGEGMANAAAHIIISGMETYAIGVYQASLTHEMHVLELTGTYLDEIQTIDLTASAATFRFQLFGSQSAEISKTDSTYVMQKRLNDDIVIPSGGRVQMTREGQQLTVVFRGLGDVPTLETLPPSEGVIEKQRGVKPAGSFRLSRSVNSLSVEVKTDASANTVKNAVSSLYSESLTVTKYVKATSSFADPTVITWTIKFNEFTGERDLVQIAQNSLSGVNTKVTTRRSQVGTAPVQGTWSISLDGIESKSFNVRASAEEVEEDLQHKDFASIRSLKVMLGDQQPGWKKNRVYPRQWILRLIRHGVVGLSAHRCTSPLYMDWNPDACPETAADLYLNIHYYYWPALLPRPADLGEEQRTQRLQARCNSEARGRGLEPGFCQALMIRETAPICGRGSGINPPCWVQRWSTANISLNDGSVVTMERDDTNTPGDTTKGYRAWRRLDWDVLSEARKPRVTTQLEGVGANMDVRRIMTLADQMVPTTVTSASETEMQVILPKLLRQSRPVAEAMLESIFQPELEFNSVANLQFLAAYEKAEYVRLNSQTIYQEAERLGKVLTYRGVWPAQSKLIFADESALRFFADSSIKVPIDLKEILSMNPPCSRSFKVEMCEARKETKTFTYHVNEPEFSVSVWLWIDESQSAPIVRSLHGSAGQGYALTLTSDGLCKFWLGTGAAYSAVSGPCPAGRLMHVAATFDGKNQALFIDGVVSEEKIVEGNFAPNKDSPLFVGGSCVKSDEPVCAGNDGQQFFGHLEQFRIYSAALSTSVIADLVEIGNLPLLHAELQTHVNGVLSKCTGDCSVGISPLRTPVVWDIEPKLVWTGREITITGQGFAPDLSIGGGTATVEIGSRDCSVISAIDSALVCRVEAPPDSGKDKTYGSVPAYVLLPSLGSSLKSVEVLVTTLISAISPSSGSMFGGTVLTISVVGMPLDLDRILVDVGGHSCKVTLPPEELFENKVVCELEMMQASEGDRALAVSLKVDGFASACSISGGCKLRQTRRDTPEISGIFPLIVKAGDEMTIDGRSLPLQGMLKVRIGDTDCTVTSRGASSIQCTLGNPPLVGRHSGRQPVFVLYETGYTQHVVDGCCPLVDVVYEFSRLTPSRGSNLGGQHVTISGSGFPLIPELEVFMGGKRCLVLSATRSELVVETPKNPAGKHTHVHIRFRVCNT